MGAKTKRAKVVRTSTEFDLIELVQRLRAPRETAIGGTGWTRESIRSARDLQMRGQFNRPKKLAAAQKVDDGLYTALRNRLAPTRGLPIELTPPNASARAARVHIEADAQFGMKGIAIKADTVFNLHEDLANHGVAFGLVTMTPRADGSRVDTSLSYWPIQFVRWDALERTFKTRVEDDFEEEVITHGDGRWVVIRQAEVDPWLWGAVIATGLVFEDRQFGLKDRSGGSRSLGGAKMVGELPPDVPIDSADGRAFLMFLATMHEALPYGLRPAGAKTELLVNTSTNWQIFDAIIKGRLGDGARVYNGHDGATTAVGGNYIKDGLLFGNTVNIVESDLFALETALFEGVIVPWTAINFGDSTLAPWRHWVMPDADADARFDSVAKRRKAMREDVKEAREAGLLVDQEYVDALAKAFELDAPRVATHDLPGSDASGSSGGRPSIPSDARPPAAASPTPLRRIP